MVRGDRKEPVTAVLGIDAAWTTTQPSGVALLSNASGRWRCVGLAPSYASFVTLAARDRVDWTAAKIAGSELDVGARLAAARALLGGDELAVVAIDMPIATTAITARRVADDEISKTFGSAWCSTHSPSEARPGAMGRRMTDAFGAAGYEIAVSSAHRPKRALIEVYPHPALLALTGATKRLEYKIGKAGREPAKVRAQWLTIVDALARHVRDIELDVPVGLTKARMKRYEDAIDALVCAWVGVEFLSGRATAYGDDETAAVWCPT